MKHFYQSKYRTLPGTSAEETLKAARQQYRIIQQRNPRRHAYVKSKYFKGDKIFIDLFWGHMLQKRLIDRTRRLRFYMCALEILRQSAVEPEVVFENGDLLYRFYGKTKNRERFCVQVKMNVRSGRKDFISVFPLE